MKRKSFSVGDWVIYQPYPGAKMEDGEITEIRSDTLAMVKYAGDRTAKATYLGDLRHGKEF